VRPRSAIFSPRDAKLESPRDAKLESPRDAKLERVRLFEDNATTMAINFRSLRDSGITWEALASGPQTAFRPAPATSTSRLHVGLRLLDSTPTGRSEAKARRGEESSPGLKSLQAEAPNGAACENGLASVVVPLPVRQKPNRDEELRLPKVVNYVALAERFQGLLDSGEVRNRADLARRFGLTRARVTQLMKLLGLHPLIIAYVKSLRPGTPARMVTERRLRVLVKQPMRKQVLPAKNVVLGFSEYVARMLETCPNSRFT